MEKVTVSNADAYCATLMSLRNAIKNKRRKKISKGIVLLHDNATTHTAYKTKDLLRRFRRDVWKHPPYRLDFAPCDYNLLGKLKDHTEERFSNDNEFQSAVV